MNRHRLAEFRRMAREVAQLRERLDEMEAKITSPRTPKLSHMPHAPSTTGYQIEADVIRHSELAELYREKLKRFDHEAAEVEKALGQLDPIAQTIMRYRYQDGYTWDIVAVKAGYSYQQTWRIYKRAVEFLEAQEAENNEPV